MNFINIFFQVLAILLLFGFCIEIGSRIRKNIDQRNQRYDHKRLKF
jgi:hypothetical protein